MIIASTMSNAQLVKAYRKAETRQVDITMAMIADGCARLRPSGMRADPDVHPLAREYLALVEECCILGIEADLRYGPGLIVLDHLVTAHGARYRRIKDAGNG